MKRIAAVLWLFALGLGLAAPVSEIEVRGADPVLSALARIALPFSVGDEPGDLEAARRAVLESGFFKDAKITLDANKVILELVPNPPVKQVVVQSKTFPPEAIASSLEANLALGAGVTYNPKRADEAREAIAQSYRRQGFPFAPAIQVTAKEETDGVVLTFAINENPELKEVALGSVTYVPKTSFDALFKDIATDGKFDFSRYFTAVQQANSLFFQAGFRGSRVDTTATLLQGGKLTVVFRELRVELLQGTDLDLSKISLKAGDPFNFDRLLDDINALSRELGREITPTAEETAIGVRIFLQLGQVRFGRITEVKVVGATALTPKQVQDALRLKAGDLYSPELANEDFGRLLNLYRQAGYELVAQPAFTFENGVYTQTVREVSVVGYKLAWDGGHRTVDSVILRELPDTPVLLSQTLLRTIYTNLAATQLLRELPGVSFEATANPQQVNLVLRLRENSSGLFFPGFGYSSFEGWSGNLTYRETNLFGLAHQPSIDFSFGQNDAGENFSLSAGYQIPWVYLDFLDLQKVRTSFGLSVYTQPRGNQKLLDPGNQVKQETGWEYTERKSGVSLGVSRVWSRDLPNLVIDFSLGTEWVDPKLEVNDPNKPKCDEDPATSEPSCSDPGFYNEDQATALLPKPYQTASVGISGTFSDVNNPRFPTSGYAARLSARYGLNLQQNQDAVQFIPLVATAKTYFGLDAAKRQALALRVSAGTIVGQPPESERFKLGGSQVENLTLRGYPDNSFAGSNLLSSSLEYRFDFRFSETGGTNVYAILFLDAASVWNQGEPEFKFGAGFGVQVNIEFFGFPLPPIRLDYGFSPDYPTGRFHFRLGPLF